MKCLLCLQVLVFGVAFGCQPAYVPTVAPGDAQFTLSCAPTCGAHGQGNGIVIDVSFFSEGRQFAACCDDVAELRSRLATVRDFWCDGLDVPTKQVGELKVGATKSQASGARGATLDQGDGYVAFNCDDWLPKLIEQLGRNECCASPDQADRES